ncbi:MAG: glycosyltransferase family 4 protein [Arenicella sp.]|nr:glycosyltransferase family 4 protein [Arenicella sp.]
MHPHDTNADQGSVKNNDYMQANTANGDKRKIKVAHIVHDLDLGGIRSVIYSIAESRLSERFCFSYYKAAPRLWFTPLGVDIIMMHCASNWQTIPKVLALKAMNYRSKIIIQEHHYTAAFESRVSRLSWFRVMLRINYSLVDKVISVSEGQGLWIKARKLLPLKKLKIIPQCRKLDQFLEVPLKPVTGKLVLCAYGRLHEQKGFDLLIHVMKRLPHINLRIAGAGPQEAQLKELAGNAQNIEFCGQISDIPRFLTECDAVIIPSLFEPFGLVCLEARAAGRPVIVSDVDGLPEQVQGCGLIVKPNSEQALYDAVNSLDERQLKRWAQQARAGAKDAWKTYINRWDKLFVTLAEA